MDVVVIQCGRKGWQHSPMATFLSHELGADWEALMGKGRVAALLLSLGALLSCVARPRSFPGHDIAFFCLQGLYFWPDY